MEEIEIHGRMCLLSPPDQFVLVSVSFQPMDKLHGGKKGWRNLTLFSRAVFLSCPFGWVPCFPFSEEIRVKGVAQNCP